MVNVSHNECAPFLLIDDAKVQNVFSATKFFGNYFANIFKVLKCKILSIAS